MVVLAKLQHFLFLLFLVFCCEGRARCKIYIATWNVISDPKCSRQIHMNGKRTAVLNTTIRPQIQTSTKLSQNKTKMAAQSLVSSILQVYDVLTSRFAPHLNKAHSQWQEFERPRGVQETGQVWGIKMGPPYFKSCWLSHQNQLGCHIIIKQTQNIRGLLVLYTNKIVPSFIAVWCANS